MDIALLCREHAPEAIARLLDLLRSDDNRAVAWAIGTIFDRAFGKALIKLDGQDALTIGIMHLLAARQINDQIMGGNGIAVANAEPPPVLDLTNAEILERLGPALE
jgi:hypothetical protein